MVIIIIIIKIISPRNSLIEKKLSIPQLLDPTFSQSHFHSRFHQHHEPRALIRLQHETKIEVSLFEPNRGVVMMVQDAYVITHVLSELERLHEWQRLKRREIIAKNKSYLLASSKSNFSSCFSFELSRQNMTLKEKKRKKK